MRVLVIDTALGACTVGVFDGARALAERCEPMAKGHSERLGGMARDVMADAGVGFDTLDRIGVTVGPGSFTGLRVGLAFAQGLGEALDRPVVGISALAALAWTKDAGEGATAAIIDARRGQVYVQTFRDGVPLTGPEAVGVEAMRDRMASDAAGLDWRLVGSGAPLFVRDPKATEPISPGASDPIVYPSAAGLAALTVLADPAEAPPSPLYLRAPDATPPTRLPGQPRAAVTPAKATSA